MRHENNRIVEDLNPLGKSCTIASTRWATLPDVTVCERRPWHVRSRLAEIREVAARDQGPFGGAAVATM
jgi:hypothetical protein